MIKWFTVFLFGLMISSASMAYNTGGHQLNGCAEFVTDLGSQLEFCKATFWRPDHKYSSGLVVTYKGPYASKRINGVSIVVNGVVKVMTGSEFSLMRQAQFFAINTSQVTFALVIDGRWDSGPNGDNYTFTF